MRHPLLPAALSALWIASVSSVPHRQHSFNASRSIDAGYIPNNAGSHQSGGEEYIVLFNSSHPVPPQVDEVLSRIQLSPDHSDVRHVYNNSAFRGFAASMRSHCIDALANMSDVAYVDKAVRVTSQLNTRTGAPWGLQRVSSASTVEGPTRALDYTYSFDDRQLGAGVDIYVVDTGINVGHAVFNGRAKMGFSYNKLDSTDQDGHGTHVSGTAAGKVLGVASGANLIGVKVLGANGVGSSIDTVNGISWVINQHESRMEEPGVVGSILSMSWALSDVSPAIDNVIRAAVSAGIHVSVAAGNSGIDSCKYPPSSSGGANGPAISVGSIGMSNTISTFSNTGACNDVYAPGENIVSAWNISVNTVEVLSGTSMACPHVTGVMAYWMVRNETLARDPAAMKAFITGSGLKNVVRGRALPGDPKILVNNGVIASGTSGVMGSTPTKRSATETERRKERRTPVNLSGFNSLISLIFGDDKERGDARGRLRLRSSGNEVAYLQS